MKVIVTGGAGFIGCHAVKRFMNTGASVIVLDNLSRRGTATNLDWLRDQGAFTFLPVDVSDRHQLDAAFAAHDDATAVIHLAGQVAVTTSVANPRKDFEDNALGTFNVLEAVRRHVPDAAMLFASTNKVYGGLEDLGLTLAGGRYQFDGGVAGIPESRPLDFHSPYGCSKGAADQYVRDYARIYGLRTVCLRQSCIYGTRQFGVEDQGWVAWFTIAAVLGRPITVYGDGCQIRDVLYVDDLCDLYEAAIRNIDVAAGRIYNVGGGPSNCLSLLELLSHLESLVGGTIPWTSADWRPGDQRVFVSDIAAAQRELGWVPRTSAHAGVEALFDWVTENREVLRSVLQESVDASASAGKVLLPVHGRNRKSPLSVVQ